MSLKLCLDDALKSVDLRPEDHAAVELARKLATAIEAGDGDLDRLSSRYLAVLESLHMTPRARKQEVAKETKPSNPIDELKAKREARG